MEPIVIGLLGGRRLVPIQRWRYDGEDGRFGKVLVVRSEIRTSVFVVVQVAEVMRISIVGVVHSVRISWMVVTWDMCNGRSIRTLTADSDSYTLTLRLRQKNDCYTYT